MMHELDSHEFPDLDEEVRDIGRELMRRLPPGLQFIALVMTEGDGGGLAYLSSVERSSAIEVLREFLEQQESLMKREAS